MIFVNSFQFKLSIIFIALFCYFTSFAEENNLTIPKEENECVTSENRDISLPPGDEKQEILDDEDKITPPSNEEKDASTSEDNKENINEDIEKNEFSPQIDTDENLYLKTHKEEDLSLPRIKAIVISEDKSMLLSHDFEDTEGAAFISVDSHFDSTVLAKMLERQFVGKVISEDSIKQLYESIKSYFTGHAYPDITVDILPQKANETIVKVALSNMVNSDEAKKKAIPYVTSIVLADNEKTLNKQSFDDARGVVVSGLDIPGKSSKLINRLNRLFINKVISKENILSLKHEIILYYKNNNRPVISVNIPKQNITKGILRVIITDATLTEINVVGNKYFSDNQYMKNISLKAGAKISEKDLLRDINFINRNPFRNVDVIYKPGVMPATTDIDLETREIRPVRAFYGADNTGLDLIGRCRYMVGMHVGNLFWQSQVLTYQITKSFASHSFEAHTFQYSVPLPWKHMINMYGGYSRFYAKTPAFPTGENKGRSSQGSIRYDIPLLPSNNGLHDIILGFDYRRTNNTVEFVNQKPVYGGLVNLTQFSLSYEATFNKDWGQMALALGGFLSPGKWLHNQTNSRYQTLRPYAKNKYFYGKASVKSLVRLPKDFSFSLLLDMQGASCNLLPSEEFGVGGYNTVRGYEEHQINGDNGVLISSEIRTPSFGMLHSFLSKKIPDHLQLLLFLDYGKAWLHKQDNGEIPIKQHLVSVGPGIRYVIDPFLSLRFDWGYKLCHKLRYSKEKSKLHFGLNISF